jgi:nicotinamidase/pyrazinamidase
MSDVLVVVDMQNDFIRGSLPVPEAVALVPTVRALMFKAEDIVLTRDWHPADHISFEDPPTYVDGSWPAHCVQNTPGAELDPGLPLDGLNLAKVLFSKGQNKNEEQYSGANGVNSFDQTLIEYMYANDLDRPFVVGLATDFCVMNTAIDLAQHFPTTVILDAAKPVSVDGGSRAVVDMEAAGVRFAKANTDVDS